jgi:hypothetical protein
MSQLHLILLVFAFVLAAVGSVWNPPRVALGWLGFASFILANML